jgi:putative endopeptidase
MTQHSVLQYSCLILLAASVHAQNNDHLHIDWMDTNYQAAENFFMYSNHNWLKKNPIPNDKGRWSIFDYLDEKVNQQIQDLLLNLPQSPSLFSKKINQQLHQYFKSGLDKHTIEKEKAKALEPFIEKINAYQNLKDLAKLTAKLHKIGVNVFYDVSSTADIHKKGQLIAGISQDGLNLPNRDYYLLADENGHSIYNAYMALLEHFFIELNYTHEDAKQAAVETWEIEKKIAEISEPKAFFRDPKNIDHPYQAAELAKKYPQLFLNEYFLARGLKNNFKINNFSEKYLQELDLYLKTLDGQQLKNYLLAHLYFAYANYMHASIKNAYCKFEMILSDTEACLPQWKQMIQDLNHFLGYAVGDIYMTHYYQMGVIEKINSMIENIKQQMASQIENNLWLSQKTKAFALLKLSKMSSRVAYSQFDIDYSSLNIKQQSYLANTIAMVQFETQRKFIQIGKPINEKEWEMPPQSINAYYDVAKNQINIPYGILQAPFFSLNANDAINYGGIGAVIGHEISHGFDDQGAQFDEKGVLKKWWTHADWQRYQERVQCIIKQYSRYPVQGTKNTYLNGQLVSGEAIADLVGLHLAYEAFIAHQSAHQASDSSIEYSPSQQFFISYAHVWASHIRDAEAIKRSRTDFHPPMQLRVNATLQNTLPFFDAFQIPKSKEIKRCRFF